MIKKAWKTKIKAKKTTILHFVSVKYLKISNYLKIFQMTMKVLWAMRIRATNLQYLMNKTQAVNKMISKLSLKLKHDFSMRMLLRKHFLRRQMKLVKKWIRKISHVNGVPRLRLSLNRLLSLWMTSNANVNRSSNYKWWANLS